MRGNTDPQAQAWPRGLGRGAGVRMGPGPSAGHGGGGARRGAGPVVISIIKRAVTGEIQQGCGEARGVAGGGARRRAGPAVMSLVERAVIGRMPLWAGQGARIGGRWRAAGGGAAASGEVSGVFPGPRGDWGVTLLVVTRGDGLSGISRGKSEEGLCCIPQDGPWVRAGAMVWGFRQTGSFEIAAGVLPQLCTLRQKVNSATVPAQYVR